MIDLVLVIVANRITFYGLSPQNWKHRPVLPVADEYQKIHMMDRP